jgi:hypothetical protein
MDRTTSRDRQYLPLPTAAAELHFRLFGVPPNALLAPIMRAALEQVARSIVPFARICAIESGIPAAIPPAELAGGTFSRGAHAFVAKTGREYRELVVQRGEMEAAVPLIRQAALKHALDAAGNREHLAAALETDPADLECYLSGLKALPPKILVAALDLVAGKRG